MDFCNNVQAIAPLSTAYKKDGWRRYAPETVVLAQIAALRKQRLYQAGVFHAAGAGHMEMTQQQGSNMEDYIHCVALLQHLHHKVPPSAHDICSVLIPTVVHSTGRSP